MGWITHGEHQHICPKCQRSWTHKGYSCEQREEAMCLTCSGPPPDKP